MDTVFHSQIDRKRGAVCIRVPIAAVLFAGVCLKQGAQL